MGRASGWSVQGCRWSLGSQDEPAEGRTRMPSPSRLSEVRVCDEIPLRHPPGTFPWAPSRSRAAPRRGGVVGRGLGRFGATATAMVTGLRGLLSGAADGKGGQR